MKTTAVFVCVLQASLVLADSPFRLHHRIWDPSSTPSPFSLRATLQPSDAVLTAPQDASEIILSPDYTERTLYQVALERPGDQSESDWDLSSVKACHLPGAQSDIINLHISSSSRTPYALDFFLHPIPHDGSCPEKPFASRAAITFTNTTLTFQRASAPPLPELRVPPPLSPKGEPIQPEPEKSFIQKYWMYIGLALLTIMITGGGASEEEGAVPRAAGR